MNAKDALTCMKCKGELPQPEPEPEPEPEVVAPETELTPIPFGLTSGFDVQSQGYNPNQAVIDAIRQFGPQPWTPFSRR